jgi:hypothetical protein
MTVGHDGSGRRGGSGRPGGCGCRVGADGAAPRSSISSPNLASWQDPVRETKGITLGGQISGNTAIYVLQSPVTTDE